MSLNESMSLEEIREFFSHDRFATEAGMTVEEARPGYARCSVILGERHKNAMGGVMGGVHFTLADLAFAVASNLGGTPTVAVHSSIQYLAAVRGDSMTAVARCRKDGKSLCYYEIEILSDDRVCAVMTATGAHV